MANSVAEVSGTSNPYEFQSYTVEQNDKNTLSMTDFFQLLATQLRYQDTSNPMETSEMMAQLTQMGMMQAMSSMTTAIDTSSNVTAQTYAAGLIGQEITVAVTEDQGGTEVPTGVKYAKVEYVSFTNGTPMLKLEGDSKEYALSHVLGVGRVPDPYKDKEEGDSDDKVDEVDPDDKDDEGSKVDPDGKDEGTDKPEETEGDKTEGTP